MKYTLESSRDFYNNYPGKRASAAMIVRHGDEYLMIKHDYKEIMTFPSGLIDPDESPLTTAMRETNEEIGLELKSEEVSFYAVTYVSEHNGFMDRFHFFFITDVDDEQVAELRFEQGIELHKWVKVDEVSELAGGRSVYRNIQHMLETGKPVPYFESTSLFREP